MNSREVEVDWLFVIDQPVEHVINELIEPPMGIGLPGARALAKGRDEFRAIVGAVALRLG